MRARTLIILMFAFFAAGGTFYLAQNWIANQRGALSRAAKIEAPKMAAMVKVLVAGNELVAGQFIKAKHLRWQAWPKDGMPEIYFVEGANRDQRTEDGKPAIGIIEGFVGSVVRSRISTGEPITEGRVVRPGDRGFLAAVLLPDMRAISVPINATTGISGFVFPGDRVDLLLTHSISFGKDRSKARRATETVLSDIRVLAVDQRTDDDDGKATLAKTATLEVTPKQAEIIAVANEIGRLSLSLRSLAQTEVSVKAALRRQYTWDSDASQLIRGRGRGGHSHRTRVKVYRGIVGTVVNFSGKPGQGSKTPKSPTTLKSAAKKPVTTTASALNIASGKVK